MTTPQITLHIVNSVLFLAAVFSYLSCFPAIFHCKKPKVIRHTFYVVCVLGVTLATVFLTLQIGWLHDLYSMTGRQSTEYVWLIFDYLLALYLLFVSTGIRVYCLWRGQLSNVVKPTTTETRNKCSLMRTTKPTT